MRYRTSVFGAAVVVPTACLYAVGMRVQNNFVVENHTGQPIRSVRVEICDEMYNLGAIPAGGQSTQNFHIACDGGYRVLATLSDGTRIMGADGEVTTGYSGLRDRIIFGANRSVTVKQSRPWP